MGNKEKKETSLAKNIVRVLMANFWSTAIAFICSFVFPKILTIEDYALYNTFTLYVGYIAILHLGFPSGMVINYAGKKYTDLDKGQYKSEVTILLSILLFFSCCFTGVAVVTQNRMLVYIAIAIIPVCLTGSYKSLYQAWSEFKVYTRINMFIATSIPFIALFYYIIKRNLPGDIYICTYLGVYWFVSVIILFSIVKKVRGIRIKPILSRCNFETEKTGLALVAGSYINTLFISAGKQFVNWFFGATEFAFYSFGISMQALMTVFITSISQPLFPAMAQGKFKDEQYNKVKEILFIFGSLSGCAYFAASIIVKLFIQKYVGSLSIIGIYFAVFPAMAIINCLYINLYKIKRMMKTYIITLSGVLLLVIVLDLIAVKLYGQFTGVAIATTVTYYVWLIIGTFQFPFIKISFRDVVYLALYMVLFFVTTRLLNDYIGIITYFIAICLLILACYGKNIKQYFVLYKHK